MGHPIEGLMDTAMKNIKSMVEVETIVGEAHTTPDGTIIIPISTVSFGFGAGGSDFANKKGSVTDGAASPMFGGGCGGGAKVKPVAFLIVGNGNVKLMPINQGSGPVDKVIDMIPDMFDKLNACVSSACSKKKPEKKAKDSVVDVAD